MARSLPHLDVVVVLVMLTACSHAAMVPPGIPASAPTAAPAAEVAAGTKPPEAAIAPVVPQVPVMESVKSAAAAAGDTPKVMAPMIAAPEPAGAGDKKMNMAPPSPGGPDAPGGPGEKKHATQQVVIPPSAANGTISFHVLPPLLPKCSADEECVLQLGKHAACKDYWCACVDGAEYDSAFSKRCLLSRTSVGADCKENGDCRVANTYCKAGSCHCAANFVFSDDASRCLPMATPADPSCSEARQCVILLHSPAGVDGPAQCVAGKCQCRYDYEHANGTCIPKKARGKSCSSDVECVDLADGGCIQGVCGCKTGHVPAVAANKCLPVRDSVAASCEEDIQCSEGLGDLARCSAGACACADGAAVSAADNNKCACGPGEEFNKTSMSCERPVPGPQQAVKNAPADQQQQQGRGGASSAASSALSALICGVVTVLVL